MVVLGGGGAVSYERGTRVVAVEACTLAETSPGLKCSQMRDATEGPHTDKNLSGTL